MASLFPILLSPLPIGPVTIPNRVVSSGHDTVMVENEQVTDQLIAYHEARAAGGVGLIILQVAGVHASARYTSHTLMADSDACLPGYTKLASALHAHGTKVFAQLFHPGAEVRDLTDAARFAPVAPSSVPTERFRATPRPLTTSEIKEIVTGYATAAARLKLAGLDGAEIVASHGYLPAQFLSPTTNVRHDAYGGDVTNRARFLDEVLSAVRAAVGPNFAVGLRISLGTENPEVPEDPTLQDLVAGYATRGLIDYLSVVTGTSATLLGSDHIAPDMSYASGYVAPLAAALKARLSVPLMIAGRINQPQDAERLLADEQTDFVAMTRALIADPELVAKAAAGTLEAIRACVGCNQACIGHFQLGLPISCIQHPESGRELLFPRLRRGSSSGVSKRVIVVGAGPAGLKAAAVAATNGHRVDLYDSRPLAGGQVLLAQLLPRRAEIGGVATNLLAEALSAGVAFHPRTFVGLSLIRNLSPDEVILATGSYPRHPVIERSGEPSIFTGAQVLRSSQLPRGPVVIYDSTSDWVAPGLAVLLHDAGHQVTLVTTGYTVAEEIQQYVRDGHIAELTRRSIPILALLRLYGVDSDTSYFQHVLTNEPVTLNSASLVTVTPNAPNLELSSHLERAGIAHHIIGDALSPRTIEEAVLEGLKVAYRI